MDVFQITECVSFPGEQGKFSLPLSLLQQSPLHNLFMMIPEMAGRQLFCVVPLCEHVGACALWNHITHV